MEAAVFNMLIMQKSLEQDQQFWIKAIPIKSE